ASVLLQMYKFGFRVARINSAFADAEELTRDKKIFRTISPEIALYMDAQGPKIRIRNIKEAINVIAGSELIVSTDSNQKEYPFVSHKSMHLDVTKGSIILIDDGNIQAEVYKIDGRLIHIRIKNDGVITDGKTVNVLGTKLNIPLLTKLDIENIKKAVELDYDFIGASFIQDASDVKKIRQVVGKNSLKIVTKIETARAIENIDEIIKESDVVMVARGDLGVELPLYKLPLLQKDIIAKCKKAEKPVIVATQMLESMKEKPRPTRAEVSDVANAILDGADAVMLSAESSVGKYPVEAVKTMYEIASEVEPSIIEQSTKYSLVGTSSDARDSVVESAINLANKAGIDVIVVFTRTGYTAQKLASYLPKQTIIAITPSESVVRQLQISRSVQAVCVGNVDIPQDRDEFVSFIVQKVRERISLLNQQHFVILNVSHKTNGKKTGIIELYSL
ncbi:MAG TPA: pyruvate kinase, partial [Candidatus Dojkabacteria bacterium]|nr:pyruvate kinase [Candidatus Dojkabacteria bacterium]